MAGIGFELKKIYGRKTLASAIVGTAYAAMATIGPMLIFIALLLCADFAISYYRVPEIESMFFVSAFTYAFLSALLISALLSTVVSRYISDMVFVNAEDDICASMFGVLTVGSVSSSVIMLILCVLMYQKSGVPIPVLAVYYVLGVCATNTYNLMTYVSALKEYRKVTLAYVIGFLTAVISFLLLINFTPLSVVVALFCALAVAFFVIHMLLVYFCVRAFGKPSRHLFTFLRYFKRYPKLVISGFTYMLGFFATNIIYWFISDMQVSVSIFHTAPNYDVAMFIAILVSLSAMIIFVVKTETAFYDKYVNYLSALNRGSYNLIEKARDGLENTIRLQLFFVYEVQLVITVVAVCIANIIFPQLGLGSQVLNLFMVLALGLYATLCMYFTIIMLYYFEAHTAACVVPCVYLAIMIVGAFICNSLGSAFYPLPLLIAAVVGWGIGFYALKRCVTNLNKFLLCR